MALCTRTGTEQDLTLSRRGRKTKMGKTGGTKQRDTERSGTETLHQTTWNKTRTMTHMTSLMRTEMLRCTMMTWSEG